ncbi:5'-nucleotidase, lipoprotein e(P4) family [Aridibaculum aurantiacum]|uniref:5'-nucleotidase, lipoprotein e(P4) family n=1 Tax=Aridibaculum aurantiacum TaxID=2810307 RepID=UPI001A975476|nr:5'-nucleotidase, lipoprotein e(P4) family [Aridibaculum aurantiacum]
MKITKYLLLFTLLGCTATRSTTPDNKHSLLVQGKMYAAFFQQHAAEYRALCYQAFNIARVRVDAWKPGTRPTAIVTDVDETILDNSPYAVHQTLRGTDHTPQEWEAWTAMAQCDTIPGSLSFLQYAASKGIEIFYLTNREESEKEGTLKNLRQFNFPNADEEHLLLKRATSKEARRNKVLQTHDILLLMGDNLSDFASLFDKRQPAERNGNTDKVSYEFGNRFIVLPNTTYGDWENAILNYNYNLTIPQKDSVIRKSLRGYK